MLRTVKGLQDYTIQATDGEIGTIDEVYFEEDTWIVRYLIVDVGNWLVGDRVLLIPAAIEDIDTDEKTVLVALTREEVKESPDIDTHKPVSRERETALHEHYDWEPYWRLGPATTMTASGTYPVRTDTARPANMDQRTEEEARAVDASIEQDEGETTLRSSDEVIGYDIQADDGEIGHVEDFIVDTNEWLIRYIIVDTRDWLPGREVLVSPTWVTAVDWDDSQLIVDLVRERVKNSPEYDADKLVSRNYEEDLHQHYEKTKYWESESYEEGK